jgi:hypothetical protein
MWVAPARISAKTLTNATQFMFCGLRYPESNKIGWGPVARPTKTNPQTHQLRNEAQLQLRCASFVAR